VYRTLANRQQNSAIDVKAGESIDEAIAKRGSIEVKRTSSSEDLPAMPHAWLRDEQPPQPEQLTRRSGLTIDAALPPGALKKSSQKSAASVGSSSSSLASTSGPAPAPAVTLGPSESPPPSPPAPAAEAYVERCVREAFQRVIDREESVSIAQLEIAFHPLFGTEPEAARKLLDRYSAAAAAVEEIRRHESRAALARSPADRQSPMSKRVAAVGGPRQADRMVVSVHVGGAVTSRLSAVVWAVCLPMVLAVVGAALVSVVAFFSQPVGSTHLYRPVQCA